MGTENSEIIYHYTSVEAAYFILSSHQIRMSSPEALNDSKELKVLMEALPKKIPPEFKSRFLPSLKAIIENDLKNYLYHIVSFSKQSDSLSQWRSYSDNARGVAIGFNREALWNDIQNQETLLQASKSLKISDCAYTVSEYGQIIRSISDTVITFMEKLDSPQVSCKLNSERFIPLLNEAFKAIEGELLEAIPSMKPKAFEEEKEVRIIRKFDSNGLGEGLSLERVNKTNPPIDFKLSNGAITSFSNLNFAPKVVEKIILGPKCPIEVDSSDLRLFLESVGIEVKDGTISRSAASYR